MTTPTKQRHSRHLLAVVLLTLAYRSVSVGRLFFTDEAWYEGISFCAFNNAMTGAIDADAVVAPATTHTLNLYPLLIAPVWLFEDHAIFTTRCVDAVVMALAMASLFCFLRQLTCAGAALVATICSTLVVNHPIFIDAGAKNAYAPALACLFVSFLYAVGPPSRARGTIAGVAFAFAVLFRESFLPFGIAFTVLALFIGRFSRADIYKSFIAGALVVICTVLLLARLRAASVAEGVAALGAAYVAERQQQSHFDSRILPNIVTNIHILMPCIGFLTPLLAVSLIGVFTPSARRHHPGFAAIMFIALLVLATPAYECLFKHSYPYHFSIFAVGLSIMCSLGCVVISTLPSLAVRALVLYTVAAASIILYIAFAWPSVTPGARDPRETIAALANPEYAASKDNFYLSCARDIRRASASHERLLTSGFIPGLVAASRRLPAVDGVVDATWFKAATPGEVPAGIIQQFVRSPPTVIVQGHRSLEQSDADSVVSSLGINFPADYELFSLVPIGKRDYGFIRARLFRRRGTDTVLRAHILRRDIGALKVSTTLGHYVPWGEVAQLASRHISLRILSARNPRSSGTAAIVRPIVDDAFGELDLAAWRVNGSGWHEWEHGGRLISSTPGDELTWQGTTRGVSLTFLKDAASGMIELTVDGDTTTVDLYSSTPTWEKLSLPNAIVEHVAFIPASAPNVVVEPRHCSVECISFSTEPPDAICFVGQQGSTVIDTRLTLPHRRVADKGDVSR